MNDKIKIQGKTKDEWIVEVSGDVTCKFLEFCKRKNVSVDVHTKVVSGGMFPDTDYFCFGLDLEKEQIEGLIKEFIG